jgi:23S rRNA (uracil1939-C5)-methyltransferase
MDDAIVEISSFSKKGFGRSKDLAGDILASIPLEQGRVKRISGKKKNALYLFEEITKKSPDRVLPRCAHFTSCGGCSLQHLSYERQLLEKQTHIETLFEGKKVLPIQGMENPWHYRGKMEYTFSQNRENQHFLGLIKPKSRGIVENLYECPITHPWFSKIVEQVREFWIKSDLKAYNSYSNEGSLQTLTLRKAVHTQSAMVILTVSGNADYALTKQHIRDFISAINDEHVALFLQIKAIAKGSLTRFYEMHLSGPDCFEEKIGDQSFIMSPQAFFQPNPVMAEKFFSTLIQRLDLKGTEKVLDLFSGIGTISILLSPFVHHIVSVEIGKEAVCDARLNLELLGISNIEIYAEDVSNFIKTRGDHFIPDIVIVDPPRAGIGKVAIDFLQTLKPPRIVYLSCNPTTQKEDVDALSSYRISFIQPFDQFPHTPHVENLIFLERL